MRSFGYYSFIDPRGNNLNGCSKASEEYPLMVNCVGRFTTRLPFTTVNAEGRLDSYLICIESGELTFYDGDKMLTAGEGSVVLLPARRGYKYTFCGEGELSYLWVHFTGSEADKRINEYGIGVFPVINKAHTENRIAQRFQGIFDAYRKQDVYRDRELSALLERLLIAVARAVERFGEGENTLSRSVKHVIANYSIDIKVPELAAMEHLSVSRYNFLFKKRMGMSPKRYILQLRMTAASELLISTDLPVKEVGQMCGYGDSHFFSKTFKGYFGVSPMEYKQGKDREDGE